MQIVEVCNLKSSQVYNQSGSFLKNLVSEGEKKSTYSFLMALLFFLQGERVFFSSEMLFCIFNEPTKLHKIFLTQDWQNNLIYSIQCI